MEVRRPQPYGKFLMDVNTGFTERGLLGGIRHGLTITHETSAFLKTKKPKKKEGEDISHTERRRRIRETMVSAPVLNGIVIYEAVRRVVGVNKLPSTYSLAKRALNIHMIEGLQTETGGKEGISITFDEDYNEESVNEREVIDLSTKILDLIEKIGDVDIPETPSDSS